MAKVVIMAKITPVPQNIYIFCGTNVVLNVVLNLVLGIESCSVRPFNTR